MLVIEKDEYFENGQGIALGEYKEAPFCYLYQIEDGRMFKRALFLFGVDHNEFMKDFEEAYRLKILMTEKKEP